MGGKKPLRRPLWPPTRATASNYYPLGLDGAGGAAKPLLRAPKKPAPLHGRLPAFSGAVDAFERARKCFLEWRYFFSIILSEFLKNRVALQEDNNGYNDDIDEIVARLSEIDVNWLIEIASDDGVLFDFVNFNYEQTWNNCLQEYSAEAYDEYLDEYVERAQNDAIAIYDSKKQDFEDVSDIFIRGIDSIIEVLKLVEELIDRYKDARISADIDNT